VRAPDLSQARRYLDALERGGTFTFQTFSDRDELKIKKSDGKVVDPNAKKGHGTLERDEHAGPLRRLNAKGAGVYVMVNAGDGKGRSAANVVRVRAVFVDTDGAVFPTNLPLRPHIVVQTSPGRWHLYWLVDGLPLSEFPTLQEALAEHYGTDPSVKDLPRVMRLPGFFHCKGEPVMVQLLEAHDHAPYSRADIFTAWPFLAERLEADRALEAEKERQCLEVLRHAAERRANPSADTDDRARAKALLQAHHDTVASAGDGSRHETLKRAAYTLGGYVAGGVLEASDIEDVLSAAAKVCSLPEGETADVIRWGLTKGAEKPLALPDRETGQITFLTNKRAFGEQGSSPNESPWVTQKSDLTNKNTTHIGSSWESHKSPWGKTCQ